VLDRIRSIRGYMFHRDERQYWDIGISDARPSYSYTERMSRSTPLSRRCFSSSSARAVRQSSSSMRTGWRCRRSHNFAVHRTGARVARSGR
jgi:hypothetical protein